MASIDKRVYFVRSKRWIAYPKAVEILGHLNAVLKHPRTTRMPSLAVYGGLTTRRLQPCPSLFGPRFWRACRAIAHPAVLDAIRDETIFRGRTAF